MTPRYANLTLAAITDAINADGGARFRELERKYIGELEDAYRAGKDDELRTHLGASVIGRECQRAIWYSFRWAQNKQVFGKRTESAATAAARMLRLWNRGHLEEGRFLAMLAMIGVTIYQYDENGEQYRVGWYGGHFGGSGDGILVGVPDLPVGVPCLGEFKTHNLKSFTTLQMSGNGMRGAKPEHYDQMQIYMHGFNLKFALYFAVCKDSDELYAEIVPYDATQAELILARAESVIFSNSPPTRIRSASPSFFTCKMCDFRQVCYQSIEPLHTCRTCKSTVVVADGSWNCAKYQVVLTKESQKVGCAAYEKLEGLR